MSPRPVVAAAILDSLSSPTALLAASRAYPPELAGQFELPGGKIELTETPDQALYREILEELGTTVTLGPQVTGPADGWWPILQGRLMIVWLATVAPGAPAPTPGHSHEELRWIPLDDIAALTWIGHDLPIVAAAARNARSLGAR